MDDADNVTAHEEKIEELRRRERAARGILTPADSSDNCAECGLMISSARQIAQPGCSLCIICAEKLERYGA